MTEFALYLALKSIARGKLTFGESVVLHRVVREGPDQDLVQRAAGPLHYLSIRISEGHVTEFAPELSPKVDGSRQVNFW